METVKLLIPLIKSFRATRFEDVSNIERFELDFYDTLSKEIPDIKDFVVIMWTNDFMQIRDRKNPYRGKALKSAKKNSTLTIDADLIQILKAFVDGKKSAEAASKKTAEALADMKLKLAPTSLHLKSIYKLSSCVINKGLDTITIRLHADTEHLTSFAAIHVKSDGSISEPNLDGGYVRISTTSEALKFISETKENFDLLIKLATEAKSMLPKEFFK